LFNINQQDYTVLRVNFYRSFILQQFFFFDKFLVFTFCSEPVTILIKIILQDVRLLKMRVPGISYCPGDVLMVQPQNLEENVQRLLNVFNLNGEDIVQLLPTEDKFPINLPPKWLCPNPCTVSECARRLLDLQAVPQRYCLQLMAHFTSSELEKERLLEFCAPAGQQDFFNYCHRPKRSTLEVLQDFPHALAALPVHFLFDVFKMIRPRAFSIASALEVITIFCVYDSFHKFSNFFFPGIVRC